jgi:acyl phosphate:glycerol-3-phosphate acyltransferase
MNIIILFITAYLAGSINVAILIFKLFGKEDPRTKFSGNAGTVNIYRQAGLFWAATVFILDFGKAIGLSTLCLYFIKPEYAPIIGFGMLLGNRFPCFHRFRGGKGVANYLGFIAVITPLWAAAAAAIWLVIYRIFKVPFIASLFMTFMLAFAVIKANDYNPFAVLVTLLTVLLIIFNHKTNIINYINKLKTSI